MGTETQNEIDWNKVVIHFGGMMPSGISLKELCGEPLVTRKEDRTMTLIRKYRRTPKYYKFCK